MTARKGGIEKEVDDLESSCYERTRTTTRRMSKKREGKGGGGRPYRVWCRLLTYYSTVQYSQCYVLYCRGESPSTTRLSSKEGRKVPFSPVRRRLGGAAERR